MSEEEELKFDDWFTIQLEENKLKKLEKENQYLIKQNELLIQKIIKLETKKTINKDIIEETEKEKEDYLCGLCERGF